MTEGDKFMALLDLAESKGLWFEVHDWDTDSYTARLRNPAAHSYTEKSGERPIEALSSALEKQLRDHDGEECTPVIPGPANRGDGDKILKLFELAKSRGIRTILSRWDNDQYRGCARRDKEEKYSEVESTSRLEALASAIEKKI